MRRFEQVDVFSPQPLGGNPVAVVLDGEGLSPEQMAWFTRWTNLSEATFLLPPTHPRADYRVRIFYAAGELDFAGHPTLGSCHAWLRAGGTPKEAGTVVQECPAGLIRIHRGADQLAFEAPDLRRAGPVEDDELERMARILGVGRARIVASNWVDNGPGWLAVMLASAEEVLALQPVADDGERIDLGVVGPYPDGSAIAYEVRAFFSNDRGELVEDPVTGSLNASLAQWLIGSGRVSPPYTASQGTNLGRTGRPRIEQDAEGMVWVGGMTHTIVEGSVDIPDSLPGG